jgi:hypothetical protein
VTGSVGRRAGDPRRSAGLAFGPLAFGLVALGGVGALAAGSRAWQTVDAARPRPLADSVVDVIGRRLDGTPTALAVVALAGVVALLATRGVARRVVGAVLVLAGLLLVWRSALGFAAVGTGRAADLVTSSQSGVGVGAGGITVAVHPVWPGLSLACGLLVALGGAVALLTAGRWSAMSARYDRPAAAPTDASLWNALDRGDDPTQDPASS